MNKMKASNRSENQLRHGKKNPWLRIVLMLVGIASLGIIVYFFTSISGKMKQLFKEIAQGDRSSKINHLELERQLENRLRAEYNAEFQAKMKDFLATQKEPREEEIRLPEIDTAQGSSGGDVRKLRSGIPFHSSVDVSGGGLASEERAQEVSYSAHYHLKVSLPKAATTVSELQKNSPSIHLILPGISKLMEQPQVSPRFKEIYANKLKRIRQDATNLNELISKHNFYDLETILHLQDPVTKRRAFLMQAEMDVVSDGSDGDRLPTMPEEIVNSTNYQPFTSYGWKKQTTIANPMIAGWEKRIVSANEELAASTTTQQRKSWLRERISYLKRGIDDMKSRSFLIADHDPFIVIPVHILTANDVYAPKVGDYAVVIHEENMYPCIVGDGGPTYKVGEASLRLAKAINSRATPYSRPESELKVTYLVFPNSREEKRSAPDYAAWSEKCLSLLNEMGGIGQGYQLHQWTNTLPPKAQ